MIVKAFAKVNLSLGVLDKRPNGYHNIESIMQSVSLCDDIEIEKANEGVVVTCSDGSIEGDDNLCYKAAEIFIKRAAEKGLELGAKIHIVKNIPLAAGLGGGSADAAAVLKGLNSLSGEMFSHSELCDMALSLGADVPFCINGGTALAEGIGEELTDLMPLPECFIVIAKKGVKSSTGDMYKKLDSIEKPKLPDTDCMIENIKKGDLKAAFLGAYNSFEQTCDAADEVREALEGMPFVYCGLSGAGPSVISIFLEKALALNAQEKLKSMGYAAFLTTPIDKGNQIIE